MDKECDLIPKTTVKEKSMEILDGYTIKYHANSKSIWSKGKIVDEKAEGYWEWYRADGTLKRSGYFEMGEPVGEWITYDKTGNRYKSTNKNKK
jgi:antitoxin component YwqK of YwqJK toxin-antitoxin module